MTTKAKFLALAAAHGIEVEYHPGGMSRATPWAISEPFAAEIKLDAPAGKVFNSTQCHIDFSLIHDVGEDGTRTNWRRSFEGLVEIIAQGLNDCPDRPNCDRCDEPEGGWYGNE